MLLGCGACRKALRSTIVATDGTPTSLACVRWPSEKRGVLVNGLSCKYDSNLL